MKILLVGHNFPEERCRFQPSCVEARDLCKDPLHSIRSYPVHIRDGEALIAFH